MAPPLENVRPMFELRGRNYIVTGGAQGIGFASTRAICELGGNVAVLDVQDKPVAEFEALAKDFGVKTFFVQTDVTKQDSLENGFKQAIEKLGGRLDGLVPAAGIAIDKAFVEQTWEEFTRIQEINVRACQPSYCYIPPRLAAHGRVARLNGSAWPTHMALHHNSPPEEDPRLTCHYRVEDYSSPANSPPSR